MPHKSKMLIHTKMEKNSLTEFRRSLIHGIPSLLLVSALSIWSIKYSFLNTIIDLKNSAPSVRITPSSLLVAYFPIMSITGIIFLVQKSIPCKSSILKISERIFTITTITGVVIMITCLLVITPLQYYAMPKLGYTRCNILEDHPTIYFTDWVKNPAWCVRGKSREWVNEQSRLSK